MPTEQQGPRGFTMSNEPKPPEAAADKGEVRDLAPIAFGTLVLSLSSSALVELGVLAAPGESTPAAPNVAAARQTIEILEMLREKTRGNLTADETQLLESVLHDLRLRFVDARGSQST